MKINNFQVYFWPTQFPDLNQAHEETMGKNNGTIKLIFLSQPNTLTISDYNGFSGVCTILMLWHI